MSTPFLSDMSPQNNRNVAFCVDTHIAQAFTSAFLTNKAPLEIHIDNGQTVSLFFR